MDASDKRSIESILGLKVRIKTTLGEDFEGEIFSYDTITNCVVLVSSQTHSTLKKSYRILKTSFIKEIQYSGKSSNIDLHLPSVNISRLRSKEEAAVRNVREEIARIGVGVTKEAQEIFNALCKTLPVRWSGENILVFDEVLIKSPYGVENCSGNDSVMLERVKKVLEGERKRLLKDTK